MPIGLHSGRVWRNLTFWLFASLVDIFAELLLIKLLLVLLPLWLFKIPHALFHTGLSVPSYPSNCAGETEKFLFLFVLIRQSFKGTNRFFADQIVLRLEM